MTAAAPVTPAVFWAKYVARQHRQRQRWMVRARKQLANEMPTVASMSVRFARQCNHAAIRGLANMVTP